LITARRAPRRCRPDAVFPQVGANVWAAVKGYLDEVANTAADPVIEKYTGVRAAADVFTAHTTFWLMESIRLDLGVGSQVHPVRAVQTGDMTDDNLVLQQPVGSVDDVEAMSPRERLLLARRLAHSTQCDDIASSRVRRRVGSQCRSAALCSSSRG
jgi:hypothetical protein